MDALTATHRLRRSWSAVALAVSTLASVALVGCSSDATEPASRPAGSLYWAVHLNWKAVTLALAAPYDTMRLTATPVNAEGNPLDSAGPVTFTTTDSSVTIASNGLLTAHYITDQATVVASLTIGGVTHTDTGYVRVTATPLAAPLATLSIQPEPDGLDSAKVSTTLLGSINQGNGNIPVYATIATGDPATDTVCNEQSIGCPFLVAFQTSDSSIARLDINGFISNTNGLGHVTFIASAYVYGVGKRDSLSFWIMYPRAAAMSLYPIGNSSTDTPYLFGGDGTRIIPGGWVIFDNYLTVPVEIVLPYQTQKIHTRYYDVAHLYQLTDTLPALAAGVPGEITFEFDSAGTYQAQLTPLGVTRGTTVRGTVIAAEGP